VRFSGTAPPPRHYTRSTQSSTDLNRRPTGCCGTPARDRATLSSRSSHWRMRGWRINPGVFVGHGWLMAAIVAGLAIGKPLGVFLAAAAAVRAGIAVKPAGVHVAAVGRGGSPRWHRLHDVALYRRAGVSKRSRLLGRQDRRVRRVDSFRPSLGRPCSGELRVRSLSKRCAAESPARKYHSPLAFMQDREQEVFR
jgi:NhaA family Na+:H+ antiporter